MYLPILYIFICAYIENLNQPKGKKLQFKAELVGLQRWLSGSERLVIYREDLSAEPSTLVGRLTNVCNSGYKGSDMFL